MIARGSAIALPQHNALVYSTRDTTSSYLEVSIFLSFVHLPLATVYTTPLGVVYREIVFMGFVLITQKPGVL